MRNLIAWITNSPTPQFVHVLNKIGNASDVDPLRVFYLRGRDTTRGWGDLKVEHDSSHVHSSGPRRFSQGFKVGVSRHTRCVVVFGYVDLFAIGALVGARISRARVYTQSDTNYAQYLESPRWAKLLKRIFLRCIYPRSTIVWVISHENAKYWHAVGFAEHRFVPFESPVPEPPMLEAIAQELRERLLWGERRYLILFVGRIAAEKGIDDAIEAVRLLRSAGVSATLAIVGAQADTHRLTVPSDSGCVLQVGSKEREELAAYYRAADVLVVPSRREPYGLVVREAMQFGLPVVATSVVASARWLCDRHWNLVPPASPPALAQALHRAIEGSRWDPMPPIDTTDFYEEELRNCCRSHRK